MAIVSSAASESWRQTSMRRNDESPADEIRWQEHVRPAGRRCRAKISTANRRRATGRGKAQGGAARQCTNSAVRLLLAAVHGRLAFLGAPGMPIVHGEKSPPVG